MQKINIESLTFLQSFIFYCIKFEFNKEFFEDKTNFNSSINCIVKYVIDNDKINVLIKEIYKSYKTLFSIFINKTEFDKINELTNKIDIYMEEINNIFYKSELMKNSDSSIQTMIEFNLLKLKFSMNDKNKEEIQKINQLIDNKITQKSNGISKKEDMKNEEQENQNIVSAIKSDNSNLIVNLLLQNNYKAIENYIHQKLYYYLRINHDTVAIDEIDFKENSILDKTDFEKLSVSIISAEKTNIGIIEYCNDNFLKLFHYNRDDIFNFSINNIIPSVIAEHHDNYINRFLRTSVDHIFQKWRIVMGLCKEGYLKPCLIYTKIILGTSSNISFLGVMKELEKTHPFFNYFNTYTNSIKKQLNPNMTILMTDENGNISGVNKTALLNFGIPFIKNSSININDLIKNINETDDYYFKKGVFTTINCQSLKNKYEDFYETFPTSSILSILRIKSENLHSFDNPYEILYNKDKTFLQHEIYIKRETLIYNNFQLKVYLYKIFYISDKVSKSNSESYNFYDSKILHKSFISQSGFLKSKIFESPKGFKKSQFKEIEQSKEKENSSKNIRSKNFNKFGKDMTNMLNSRNNITNTIIKSISFIILLIVFSSSIIFFTNSSNEIIEKNLKFEIWSLFCINTFYIFTSINNIINFAKHSELVSLPYSIDENGTFISNVTVDDLNSTLIVENDTEEPINSIIFKALNFNQTIFSINYINNQILSDISYFKETKDVYFSKEYSLYKNESISSYSLNLIAKMNSFNNEFTSNFNEIRVLRSNRTIYNKLTINDLDILARLGLNRKYMIEKNLLLNYLYILKTSSKDLLWNFMNFYRNSMNFKKFDNLIFSLVVVLFPIGISLFGILFYVKAFDNIYDIEETIICLIYTFYKGNLTKLFKFIDKILNKNMLLENENCDEKEIKQEKTELDVSKHSKANSSIIKKEQINEEKKSRITFTTDTNTNRNLLSEKNSAFLENKKLIKSIKKQINKLSPTKKNVIAVLNNENNEDNILEDEDYFSNLMYENKEELGIEIKSYYGIKFQFTVIFLIMICLNILLLIFSVIFYKQNQDKNELVELIGQRSIFISYILILIKKIIHDDDNIKIDYIKSDISFNSPDDITNLILNDLSNDNLKKQLDYALKYSFYLENEIKSKSELHKSNFYLKSYFNKINEKESNTTCTLINEISSELYKEILMNSRSSNFLRRNVEVNKIKNLVINNKDSTNYLQLDSFNSTVNLTFIENLLRFNDVIGNKNFNFFFYDTVSKINCSNENHSMYLVSKINYKDMYNSIRSILLEISNIIISSNEKDTLFSRLNFRLNQLNEIENIITGYIPRAHKLEISFITNKCIEVNKVFTMILKILFSFSILFSGVLIIFLVYTNKKANTIYQNISQMVNSTPIHNEY